MSEEIQPRRPMKDPRINELLAYLDGKLGLGSLVISDYWEADKLAIGLCSVEDSSNLVYVALKKPNSFTVIWESAPEPGSVIPCKEIGTFECGSLEDVRLVVQECLSIECRS
jgi:hypothetical protein